MIDRSPSRPRVAIVGGGISGLAAAYQLTVEGVEWSLFEASSRLGGIVETIYCDDFVIECGPDSWVTEKPWARELAVELGLAEQIIPSNDARRRTYVQRGSGRLLELVSIPDGMRMMVPSQWGPLLESPLFSWQARLAYLREPKRAAELKAAAPAADESIASFVRRHFGDEVAHTVAGPLLSAIFGGDIEQLSVRTVMPGFVRMEAEHGSLIQAVQQAAARRGGQPPEPVFTTLLGGLQTFIDALVDRLPSAAIHLNEAISHMQPEGEGWRLHTATESLVFDTVVLATPPQATAGLLKQMGDHGGRMAALLPAEATSAIAIAFAFAAQEAAKMRVPRGFGYVVPASPGEEGKHSLLACTFVDHKFPGRVPDGAVLLRAFFGGSAGEALLPEEDAVLVELARSQVARVLGPLPQAAATVVRRWPRSLPQYGVGHLQRMAELQSLLAALPGLRLIGSAYYGVGLPDLVRQGRATAQAVARAMAKAV